VELERAKPLGSSRGSGGAPSVVRREKKSRRWFFFWFSIEMAAGIVALSEIVFTLPSVIFLELGRTNLAQLLPLTVLSGTVAVYLGWCAFPLVGQVAQLGRTSS
jgi:hypothetical protein